MAKVVGKDKKAVKRVTCSGCASIVEYTQNEVKEINGRDYGGGPDGCTYITCPQCQKRITLTSW